MKTDTLIDLHAPEGCRVAVEFPLQLGRVPAEATA